MDALSDVGGSIKLRPGTYRESVNIAKSNVQLEGDDSDPAKVVVVFDKHAATAGGTLNSATLDVKGDDFFAHGITIANDFWQQHPEGGQGWQAVALSVSGDRAVFSHVRLLGAQDTLFVGSKGCVSERGPCTPARQYFADCYVEGHVDFIFGDAKAYFEGCEVHALARKTVWLTAQSRHYAEQDSGFVFDHCHITAEPGAEHVYFGRPWRPYSTVVFMNTRIDATLEPAGWAEWHPGETHSLETATYREFRSRGVGAQDKARDPHSRQLTTAEAARYEAEHFFATPQPWKPAQVRDEQRQKR